MKRAHLQHQLKNAALDSGLAPPIPGLPEIGAPDAHIGDSRRRAPE
jgi:hypothetical protein